MPYFQMPSKVVEEDRASNEYDEEEKNKNSDANKESLLKEEKPQIN